MDRVLDQLRAHTWDSIYFSARSLAWLSTQTGQPADLLAQGLTGLLVLYLLASPNAFFVANLIVVLWAILVTYVFTDERPPRDLLLVYWGAFMSLTTFDRTLEQIPGYYVMKLALLALFFLDPFSLADKINKLVDQVLEQYGVTKPGDKAKSEKTGASPAPEKPEEQKPVEPTPSDVKTAKEASIRSTLDDDKKTAREPVPGYEDVTTAREASMRIPMVQEKVPSLRRPVEEEPKTAKELSIRKAPAEPAKGEELKEVVPPTPIDKPVEAKTPSSTRSAYVRTPQEGGNPFDGSSGISDGRPVSFRGPNPMTTDSSYRLRSEGKGIPNKTIGLACNLNDMLFFPMERLVFNGPFDYDVAYHMKVINNSHHDIAFAIKGNCIPRVTAYPPCGILKPQEKIIVAVTLRPFQWDETQYSSDRICYEYVLLKKPATEFSHGLLEDSDLKRRKNIFICYNT